VSADAVDVPPSSAAALDGEAVERRRQRRDRRRGLLLAMPAFAYMIVFFAVPLIIVLVYSFATRTRTGDTSLSGWNLEAYRKLGEPLVRNVVVRSAVLAGITTAICLVFAYPFAYFAVTRRPIVRNLMLVSVMIPFWTNFLVRKIMDLLRNDGMVNNILMKLGIIHQPIQLLFTDFAIGFGMTYVYLPLMVLPIYASIEKLDFRLVEAAYDLYANRWNAFWRVILPLVKPGIIAGSILVFIPSLGAYVTPRVLGGGKNMMLGNLIELQFGQGRNWPLGAALSITLMAIVMVALLYYVKITSSEARRNG